MNRKLPTRIGGTLALILLTLAWGRHARAEIMQTTGSLAPGNITFGTEFQAGVSDPPPFMVNFQEAVGLASGLDLLLRQGVGLNQAQPIYLGFGLEWTILTRNASRPGLALLGGGHYMTSGRGGADLSFLLDYRFGRFVPFVGLDSQLEVGTGGMQFLLAFLFGGRFQINRHVAWFAEAGLDLTFGGGFASGRHFLATGPKILF